MFPIFGKIFKEESPYKFIVIEADKTLQWYAHNILGYHPYNVDCIYICTLIEFATKDRMLINLGQKFHTKHLRELHGFMWGFINFGINGSKL